MWFSRLWLVVGMGWSQNCVFDDQAGYCWRTRSLLKYTIIAILLIQYLGRASTAAVKYFGPDYVIKPHTDAGSNGSHRSQPHEEVYGHDATIAAI